MNSTVVTVDTTHYLKLFVTDVNGNPKVGLSINYAIKKAIDDSLITSGSLVDSGGGIYDESYLFSVLGQFYVIYTTPAGYTDEIEQIIVQSKVAQQDSLLRSLGLAQSNYRILNQVYDGNGDLTSATMRLYNNATDANNDINHFAEYQVTVGYTNRLVSSYKSIQVL